METEETSCTEQAPDITNDLANLIAAGWTEAQIARMARQRALYSRDNDTLTQQSEPKVTLSATEQQHLSFVRWLYTSGRLAA